MACRSSGFLSLHAAYSEYQPLSLDSAVTDRTLGPLSLSLYRRWNVNVLIVIRYAPSSLGPRLVLKLALFVRVVIKSPRILRRDWLSGRLRYLSGLNRRLDSVTVYSRLSSC